MEMELWVGVDPWGQQLTCCVFPFRPCGAAGCGLGRRWFCVCGARGWAAYFSPFRRCLEKVCTGLSLGDSEEAWPRSPAELTPSPCGLPHICISVWGNQDPEQW